MARSRPPSIAPERGTVPGPLIQLIWLRLARIRARVETVLEQIRTGKLRTRPPGSRRRSRQAAAIPATGIPPTPEPDAKPAAPEPSAAPPAGPRLPHGSAWLLHLALWDSVAFANHMRLLLLEPEMQALIAAWPQLRRALQPLRRMLGLEDVIPPAPHRVAAADRGPRAVKPGSARSKARVRTRQRAGSGEPAPGRTPGRTARAGGGCITGSRPGKDFPAA